MRILLVDDEVVLTDSLKVFLSRGKHTVEILNYVAGKEAFDRYLEDFSPHGIILDYEMQPRGVELYTWVRRWSGEVPIVFYTKHALGPEHVLEMRDIGATPEQIVLKQEAGTDVPLLLKALGWV